MNWDFSDKVIVITGARERYWFFTTTAFGEAKAKVIIIDISAEAI